MFILKLTNRLQNVCLTDGGCALVLNVGVQISEMAHSCSLRISRVPVYSTGEVQEDVPIGQLRTILLHVALPRTAHVRSLAAVEGLSLMDERLQ